MTKALGHNGKWYCLAEEHYFRSMMTLTSAFFPTETNSSESQTVFVRVGLDNFLAIVFGLTDHEDRTILDPCRVV